jgi:hypothetical protein
MVTKSSFITFPHHMSIKEILSSLFLNHILFSHWRAASSSTPQISTIKCNSPSSACPTQGFQNSPHYKFTLKMATAIFAETLIFSTFNAAHTQNPKLYTELMHHQLARLHQMNVQFFCPSTCLQERAHCIINLPGQMMWTVGSDHDDENIYQY